MKKLLLTLLCSAALSVVAQTVPIEGHDDYAARFAELGNAYSRDPHSVETLYAFALFYFDNSHPMRSLPTAMKYIQLAEQHHIALLNDNRIGELTRLGKKHIDLMVLRQTKQAIAEAALNAVKRKRDMGELEIDTYMEAFGHDAEVARLLRRHRLDHAYRAAVADGSADACYAFIELYPATNEAEQMEKHLATLAPSLFANVATEAQADSIAARFAKSPSVVRAAARCKSRLAYATASRSNTAAAYTAFLNAYPTSDEQLQAHDRLDALLEAKYYTLATAQEYADFAEANPDNPLADSALAEIRKMIEQHRDLAATRIYLARFQHDAYYARIYNLYFSWFAAEGNSAPLLRFEEENPAFPSPVALENELERSRHIDMLNLMGDFVEPKYETYALETRRLMDKRIAFVLLQRMLQQQVAEQRLAAAKARAQQFELCFEGTCADEYAELLDLLGAAPSRRRLVAELATLGGVHNPAVNAADGMLYFTSIDSTGASHLRCAVRTGSKWGRVADVTVANADGASLRFYGFFAGGKRMLLGDGNDIWIAERDGDQWRVSDIPPYPVNTDFIETDAYMLADGSGMLLASDRPGGYNLQRSGEYFHGDTALATDLYFIPYTQSGWGAAVNLGPGINTPYCERSPMLSRNQKTLYFITDSRGLGYGDVYMATRDDSGDWTRWSRPVNVGRELNSPFAEASLSMSPDERTIYLSSNREGHRYACYSFATWHDTSALATTYPLNVRGLERNLTRVRVADMGRGEAVRQVDLNLDGGTLGVGVTKGHRYAVLGDAGQRFVPAVVVDAADTGAQHLRGYTYTELVAMDRPLPLPAVAFVDAKAQPTPSARLQLEQLAQFVGHHEACVVEVVVDVALRDDARAFNLALARGAAVRDCLAANGIDAARISVSAYGNVNTKQGAPEGVAIRFRERY